MHQKESTIELITLFMKPYILYMYKSSYFKVVLIFPNAIYLPAPGDAVLGAGVGS